MKTDTTDDREAYPDGTIVVVTTPAGVEFRAYSSGSGVAWAGGHAWIHPDGGDTQRASRDAYSWGRAAAWRIPSSADADIPFGGR